MASTELLLAFALSTALFAYMPGPAMLYTTAQTIARGRRAGLMASLGIHLGGYVHVIAAATGLSMLFHGVPAAYMLVKLAGAVYLVWLGLKIICQPADDAPDDRVPEPRSARAAFFESITVEVLNPKTALFFLAFLPQFVDPAAAWPVWVQFLVLGTVVNLMFSSADLVCVLLAGALAERFRASGRASRIARRAGGAVLVGLGLHLALRRS